MVGITHGDTCRAASRLDGAKEKDVRAQAVPESCPTQPEALLAVANRLNERLDLDVVLNDICEITAQALAVRRVIVVLRDVEGGGLSCPAAAGVAKQYTDLVSRLPQSTYDWYFETMHGKVAAIPVRSNERLPRKRLLRSLGIDVVVGVPLPADGDFFGALVVLAGPDEKGALGETAVELLRGIGAQAAVAIHNARLVSDLEKSRSRAAESERHYRDLVEHEPNAILVHHHGRVVCANPSAALLLGVADSHHLLGRQLLGLIESDSHAEVGRLSRSALRRHKTSPPIHARLLREDGSKVDARIVQTPLEFEGARATMFVASDITEQVRAEEEVRNRLRYEGMLAAISSDAVAVSDLGSFLDRSLARIGGGLGVSRSYICEYDEGGQTISVTHEWVDGQIGSEEENRRRIPVAEIGWFTQQVGKDAVINIEDIGEIPGEAGGQLLRARRIRSILAMPLWAGASLRGFVGLAECSRTRQWPEHDVRLLRSMSQIISGAMERWDTLAALARAHDGLEQRVHERTNQLGRAAEELSIQIERRREVEERLVLTSQRLEHLLRAGPAVIYACEAEEPYSVTFVSENAKRQILCEPSDFLDNPGFWASRIHPDDAGRAFEELPELYVTGSHVREYRWMFGDGGYRWVHDEMNLVSDAVGKPVEIVGSWTDISGRKEMEDRVRAQLAEKDVLLREVHHRVKNNLQVISSLVNLQKDNARGQAVDEAFGETQSRIKAMALVHQYLYRSHDLTRIDFDSYVRALVDAVRRSVCSGDEAPNITVDASGVFLGLDLSVPCGLIVTELLSNALKHAFPRSRRKKGGREVRIELRQAPGDTYTMKVSDNGVGLPAGMDFRLTDTLGLQLVMMLVEQMHGTIEMRRDGGTQFVVEFPRSEGG